MLRVGFTGPREGMTERQKERVRDAFAKIGGAWELHHGDCVGADADAHAIAREFPGCVVVLHPPENDALRAFCAADRQLDPLPCLERNQAIVDACDVLIATPRGPEEKGSGTWSTIRYAQQIGRQVRVVGPGGFPITMAVSVEEWYRRLTTRVD